MPNQEGVCEIYYQIEALQKIRKTIFRTTVAKLLFHHCTAVLEAIWTFQLSRRPSSLIEIFHNFRIRLNMIHRRYQGLTQTLGKALSGPHHILLYFPFLAQSINKESLGFP
jgi:hypothetical protein